MLAHDVLRPFIAGTVNWCRQGSEDDSDLDFGPFAQPGGMKELVVNNRQTSATDFDAFVRRQAALAKDHRVDWAKERDEWLGYLKLLYDQIESFLAKYIQRGEIKIEYRDTPLNEENIGDYSAREMVIRIGQQVATITPVGTLIIGSKGRVEVAGPAGRARLVLVDRRSSGPRFRVDVKVAAGREPAKAPTQEEDIIWTWKIATSPPSMQYIELTQESFFQMLMEIANG